MDANSSPKTLRVMSTILTQTELKSLLEEDETEKTVVFSDPSLHDNPTIYVSEEFETQTGYAPEEVLGRN